MILLDTKAVPWILSKHQRAAPLRGIEARLFVSPVSLLELEFLQEVGRIREAPGRSLAEVADDPRWELDNPDSEGLFRSAMALEWTRDPFDRLLVAHATRRCWRLASGDRESLARLGPDKSVSL